jgi:fumarylacetoacetate (FAA) hydrolase
LTRFIRTSTTLQHVLDTNGLEQFQSLYDSLNNDSNQGEALDVSKLKAPLPRAYEWLDGSAYINHVVLVRKARNAEPPATLKTDPLVYQGGSGVFLGPTQDIEHFSTDFGIDFESEIGIITDDIPMGTKKQDALSHIKLITILNDVSLRNLIPDELAKGFGFVVSKPATAFAPVAITPDELSSDEWKEGRVHLPLNTYFNGQLFGSPDAGPEMHFSFLDLIEHLTRTRSLTAGTVIGSGTVSNEDRSKGSSCLAEKRMIEKIDTGAMTTPFMQFGDSVEIYMNNSKGQDLFGHIKQKVVQKK